MVTTSNLEENRGNDFKGQFDEGEDYGLPQLDFSPLDPLEFNESGIKTPSSGTSIDVKTQTIPDANESTYSPLGDIKETSAYIHQSDGKQKLKFILVVVLGILFASIIGIILLSMNEDPKPTIKAEVKKEIKKEIISEPVIEEVIEEVIEPEVIEPEIKTDPSDMESAPKGIGVISEISQPLNKYYLVVASFLDNDLAFDYAEKLILSGSNVTIIPPFSTSKFTRVALLEHETLDKVKIGLDKYKDEFDEQLWVLKY
jgi:hypothetical protein